MEWKENVEYKNIHNDRLIKITGKIITDVGNTLWRGEAIDETPLTSKGKGDVVIECIVICAHVCYLNYYLLYVFFSSILLWFRIKEDKKILCIVLQTT